MILPVLTQDFGVAVFFAAGLHASPVSTPEDASCPAVLPDRRPLALVLALALAAAAATRHPLGRAPTPPR